MIVPEGGFGRKLDDMYNWHLIRDILFQRGRSRRDENGRDYIRWCFADAETAAAFAFAIQQLDGSVVHRRLFSDTRGSDGRLQGAMVGPLITRI
jgi:hypothetical protein